MTEFDIERLSLKELKSLEMDLAKAISNFVDRQKSDARSKLEVIANEMGYSLAELISPERKRTRAPAAAKYRHPENADITWTGRGLKPRWFVSALEAGRSLDDLAVN